MILVKSGAMNLAKREYYVLHGIAILDQMAVTKNVPFSLRQRKMEFSTNWRVSEGGGRCKQTHKQTKGREINYIYA